MPGPPLHIQSYDLHLAPLRTRMPFRYGIATMTEVPCLFVRIWVTIEGRTWAGLASDLLPPKWFTKNPATPLAEEIAEMLRVIRHASASAIGLRGGTAFELWRQIYQSQAGWGQTEGLPPLLSHFGTSLVERALLDAVCRASGHSFARMLRENRFGIELGDLHAPLRGLAPSDLLPEQPLTRLTARHTVGLADPLTEAEIPAAERLEDGLPQSLESCVARYGLRHFKIKVMGDTDRDLDRLDRVAALLEQRTSGDFAFSLDGNEQFGSVEAFRTFYGGLAERLPAFLKRLLFVEQPLPRAAALLPEVEKAFYSWPDRPPIIIDESDAMLEDAATALRLGYAGTSHKNCKGVFKGIANFCLLQQRRREQPESGWIMSGEDLCNVGPVALLQDLAVMASLGIESVERNGHHYHAGLSQFPAEIQRQTLRDHPDLYQLSPAGWPTLRIDSGRVRVDSVVAAPFGMQSQPELELFEVVEKS